MDTRSKKRSNDKESVRLRMEELRQDRFYSVKKYEVSKDPIVSWTSPWQKKKKIVRFLLKMRFTYTKISITYP